MIRAFFDTAAEKKHDLALKTMELDGVDTPENDDTVDEEEADG